MKSGAVAPVPHQESQILLLGLVSGPMTLVGWGQAPLEDLPHTPPEGLTAAGDCSPAWLTC
jgi:hypothetical protein